VTQLLNEALRQVNKLPEGEQDAIAAVILEELESEERWQEAFARSERQLAELAREALEDYRAGRTTPLDPDAL